ncbi:hypothetical protein EPI10_006393 [Gossypium australe]|uniref:Uncharacterized protein n=1 Tax=Gossypium australe TaxID=47621 RepID=A0A5B6WQY3_9ROSI|nr:hypothetical protein EPI10_006393 [Gossypium australe]
MRLNFNTTFHPPPDSYMKHYMADSVESPYKAEDVVKLIRDKLKVTSDRKKSYANLKWKDNEYAVGDKLQKKVESQSGTSCLPSSSTIRVAKDSRYIPCIYAMMILIRSFPYLPMESIEI